MTPAPGDRRAAVRWLTAQAVAFGVVAALLGIVANALFLDEYGSEWLPVTYLFIAGAGVVVSGAVARSARRRELVRIASTVLGTGVVVFVAAWLVAALLDGDWVSAPLLVLFPVLLQLGFVFVASQAGRILDIGGIKADLPRIVAGFPVGALAGGLAAGPLLTVSGRTEDLLLATAAAQIAFLALLVLTGRRFSAALGAATAGTSTDDPARPPLRALLASRLVVAIVGYQVLSALASQLADFLVFDRASARYGSGAELARFFARYTALMNAVCIVFLALVAGRLLRRFGLRLGITTNPAVLAVFAAAMVVITAVSGSGSFALFVAVASARIADIALTDGTTRTSINATYQVLPAHERLAVQASVEGVGVPVAIGVAGVVVIVLDLLPFAVGAVVTATAIVSVLWAWVGWWLYREYGSAIVDALRRPVLLDAEPAFDDEEPEELVARSLLASGDGDDVRLGLDMLAAMGSPLLAVELARMTDDSRPEIRVAALARLAEAGDGSSRRALSTEVVIAAASADPEVRRSAARAIPAMGRDDRASVARLLVDPDPRVRSEAVDGVQPGDTFAIEPLIEALADARTCATAASALARLGDDVGPAVEAVLGGASWPAPRVAHRVVRAARLSTPAVVDGLVARHAAHRDRELGLALLEASARSAPTSLEAGAAVAGVLHDDVDHAVRTLCAMQACATFAGDGSAVLGRALADELDLLRRRMAAGLVVRHGAARVDPSVRSLTGGDAQRALAVEALEVVLERGEAALVLPVLLPGLTPAERLARLPAPLEVVPVDAGGWLAELIADPADRWRSPWLRACALYATMRAGFTVVLGVDLRALADPVIDELLDAISPSRSRSRSVGEAV